MRTLQAEFGFRRTAANAYLMLRNAAYVGRMAYNGVGIPCPAIVSQALWDKTQECLTKNLVRGAKGNTQTDYLLQQTITCAGCGRILGARTRREKSGRTKRYYRCRGYTRRM